MSLIQARIKAEDKAAFVKILEDAGLDVAGALRIYVRTVIRYGEFPFWLMTPNAKTVAAMQAVLDSGSYSQYEDVQDFGGFLEKIETEAASQILDSDLARVSERSHPYGKQKKDPE